MRTLGVCLNIKGPKLNSLSKSLAQFAILIFVASSSSVYAGETRINLLKDVLGHKKVDIENQFGVALKDTSSRHAAIPLDHILYRNQLYIHFSGDIADSIYVFSVRNDWEKAINQFGIEAKQKPIEIHPQGIDMLGWGPNSKNNLTFNGKSISMIYGPKEGVLSIAFSLPPSVSTNGKPCSKEDKIYFSCRVHSGKQLIICGSEDLKGPQSWLQYQFGSNKSPELIFPSQRENSTQLFLWNSQPVAGGSRSQVTFTNHETTYTLTILSQGREEQANIEVKGKKPIVLACKGQFREDFSTFESALKCDQTSAIACP